MKFYKSERTYYREGRTYHPGEVISLPDGEPPSKSWVQVNEKGEDTKAPPVQAKPVQNPPQNQGRPSDRRL